MRNSVHNKINTNCKEVRALTRCAGLYNHNGYFETYRLLQTFFSCMWQSIADTNIYHNCGFYDILNKKVAYLLNFSSARFFQW